MCEIMQKVEQESEEKILKEMADAVRVLLVGMGEDPDRGDLLNTPMRFAKALRSFTPHKEAPAITTFPTDSKGTVKVQTLEVRSMCAHHLFPFFGTCDIIYIPNGQKAGLSKFQRALNFIATRPQDQEHLTMELLEFLREHVKPKAMAIKIKCKHTCMTVRGVHAHEAETETIEYFNESADLDEFNFMLSQL